MKILNSRWTDDIVVAIVAYAILFFLALHVVKAVYVDAAVAAADLITTTSPWGQTYVQTAAPVETNLLIMIGDGIMHIIKSPFSVFPTNWHIIPAAGICLIADAIIVMVVDTMSQIYRTDAPGREHGSAKWNKDYLGYSHQYEHPYNPDTDPFDQNIILSDRIKLDMDNQKTGRNLNVLIVGGSGTGKSWKVIKPNIAQANCSMLVTDPSGELFFSTGKMLINKGIRVKLFSTSDMEHSNCYNPFDYVYDENGNVDEVKVSTMISLFLKNADNLSNNKSSSADPFWEKSAKAFISALVYYLLESPNIDKRDINFAQVLKLTQAGKVSETSDTSQSTLDIIMQDHKQYMEAKGIESKAILNYDTFKLAPARTANSILISAAVDLQLFGDDKVKNLTRTDYDNDDNNLHLEQMGNVQSALFINIPQANSTYNFLVAMLYSQAFDAWYTMAEKVCPNKYIVQDKNGNPVITMLNSEKEAKECLEALPGAEIRHNEHTDTYQVYKDDKVFTTRPTKETAQKVIDDAATYTIRQGSLKMPWHIRCLLDEFANISEIPNFSQYVSTMRKYEISCTIVLQSIAQLKARYKDDYQTIIGNCDTFLFLGSSETDTLEYVSKLLGDTTVRTKNTSVGAGKNGGSESFSYTKRALMTPQEVGNINNGRHANRCIVKIRDIDPFLDDKYSFNKHPNWKETGEAGHANEIDLDYLDQYFNSAPMEEREARKSKRTSQEAANEIMGSAEIHNIKDMDDVLDDAGIEDGNIDDKFELQMDADNLEGLMDYELPESDAQVEYEPDGGQYMPDNIFFF